MRNKKLWLFLTPALSVLVAASLYLNFRRNGSGCNGNTMEIWSHRGVHHSFPENSRPAVDEAYASGFGGVEIDLFYDEELGLVVSHDHPYIPVDGRLVTLGDIIYGYGDNFRFWLDLKNLRNNNLKGVRKALNAVFAQEPGLRERVFLESGNGAALRRLNGDFNCIYWVQFSRSGVRGWLKRTAVKLLISITDFDGITTDHRYIDGAFARHFRGKCWYVFTVNSGDRLRLMEKFPEIEVVLTDMSMNEVRLSMKEAGI